ncbi:MAG: MFS transporter, partial [Proteobacteria bacterium]|nr:MFS transporter [Pseudomonadota bacterium]
GRFGYQYSYFTCSLVLMAVWAFFIFNQRNGPEDLGLPPISDEDEGQSPADLPHEPTEEQKVQWSRQVLTNILIIGCFYFFLKFIRYALWSWAPYLLQTNFGLRGDEAGFVATIFDVCGITGVIICGWMSDRFFHGRRAMISFIFVASMVAACAMLYTSAGNLVLFAVSMGLVGFTLYGPDSLMTGAGAMDVGSKRSAVMAAGIINGMGSVGSVAQEQIFGYLLDRVDTNCQKGTNLAMTPSAPAPGDEIDFTLKLPDDVSGFSWSVVNPTGEPLPKAKLTQEKDGAPWTQTLALEDEGLYTVMVKDENGVELCRGDMRVEPGAAEMVFAVLLVAAFFAAGGLGVLLWRNHTGAADM